MKKIIDYLPPECVADFRSLFQGLELVMVQAASEDESLEEKQDLTIGVIRAVLGATERILMEWLESETREEESEHGY